MSFFFLLYLLVVVKSGNKPGNKLNGLIPLGSDRAEKFILGIVLELSMASYFCFTFFKKYQAHCKCQNTRQLLLKITAGVF